MDDLRDRYLDLALEEVAGRRAPPDLSAVLGRISAGRPRRSGELLSFAAALLILAIVLSLIVSRRPASGTPVPSTAQEPLESPIVIPPARTVTLDFPGGTLRQAAAALSAASNYVITVEDEVAGSQVPPLRLSGVSFLEALCALERTVPGVFATAQPADPSLPVTIGAHNVPDGWTVDSMARQVRDGVALEVSAVRAFTVPRTLSLTVDLEPAHRRFRFTEYEIIDIKDERGAEVPLRERSVRAPRGHGATFVFQNFMPEQLSRLRVRARLVYVAQEHRVPLTVTRDPHPLLRDGLRIIPSFHPYERGLIQGDDVRVRLEPVEGDPKAGALLQRIESFHHAGVHQLVPAELSEGQILSRNAAFDGGSTVLSFTMERGRLKGEMKVDLVLPVEVATRTVDFDLKDLKIP